MQIQMGARQHNLHALLLPVTRPHMLLLLLLLLLLLALLLLPGLLSPP